MKRALLGAVLLFSTVLTVEAVVPMAGAQTPTAAPPTEGRGGTTVSPTTPGRGGGFRNPAAALYTENCAGCHGAELTGGRAPSLFDSEWLHGSDDESIAKNIHEGFPAAGMIAFKDVLSDQQIWQLVAYIRTQADNLKGKPAYVPDPANQIIKSEKQTFKIEVVTKGLETPWAIAFLPDGRLLVTERPGRLRIIENGKLLPEGVKGLPKVWEKQDGGMFDVEYTRSMRATAGSTSRTRKCCLVIRHPRHRLQTRRLPPPLRRRRRVRGLADVAVHPTRRR